MDIKTIELEIINCIKGNIEDSGDEVPEINRGTGVFTGIAGFDSLRAIEVLISLEEVFDCELPPEKVFVKKPPGTDDIGDVAKAVQNIVSKG
jgi:acyl carrier protein